MDGVDGGAPSSPEVDAELSGVGVIQSEGLENLKQVASPDEGVSKHFPSRKTASIHISAEGRGRDAFFVVEIHIGHIGPAVADGFGVFGVSPRMVTFSSTLSIIF